MAYEIMCDWAQYKISCDHYQFGSSKSFLERVLDGMPTTKCRKCNGMGRVPAEDYLRTFRYVECSLCQGDGKVKAKSSATKINPAFIRATGSSTPINELGELISKFVLNLSDMKQAVIYQEFLSDVGGTMEEKAARIDVPRKTWKYLNRKDQVYKNRKKGIRRDYYSSLLSQILKEVWEHIYA